jgi:ribonuclease III
MSKIDSLQRALGVEFKHPSLLEQALIHDSYVNENPAFAPTSNERLEFLGDAVLGLIVAERVYHDLPGYSEGQMTHLRAALVRRETLAKMAKDIGLGDYLYLGKGEEASGGRAKVPNLAGAMEAVIGAVFLDLGMRVAKSCTLRLIRPEYQADVETGVAPDYKSRLQELIQGKSQKTPVYVLVDASGPDHAKTFVVEVRLGDGVLGRGSGKNKKMAEAEAARDALRSLDGST